MYDNALRKAQEETLPSDWTGTGFALKNNYVVTNYHVIDGAKSISVLGINGNFTKGYSADVIATDKNIDLAILEVKGVVIPSANIPYSVKTTNAEVGEEVFVLGYPMTSTMGEEIKLTTGVVSSRSGFQGDVSLYQTTAPIQPGNSGGPLFDSKGNIIGIVSAKHRGAENVGYAIKASYLRNLLESSISSNILPQSNKIAGQNLSGKVKSAKNYVYYIVCTNKIKNGDVSVNTNKEISFNTAEESCKKGYQYYDSNPKEAFKYFNEAANQGYAKAQHELAGLYFLGKGIAQSDNQAYYWEKKAADQGYSTAVCNLGYFYEFGRGVKKNYAKAVELYTKAANQGNYTAQNNLGMIYEFGKCNIKRNYNKAKIWYQKAVDQGDNKAQYNLGRLYEEGRGVGKNLSKAAEWYQKAADQGNKDAQNDLGVMYYLGEGVTKDYSKALDLFFISANQGHSDAQYYLGEMYEKALGVEKDYTKAAEWYKKAADQGDKDAKEALKRIEKLK